jgi:hypothetical protein
MTASFEDILRDMSNPGDRMDFIDHALHPPEPQLLDTCILQNLDWVDRRIEQAVCWDDAAVAALTATYGEDMANDLLDLGAMYKHFEDLGGYPWLVCDVNASEASLLGGDRGIRLNDIIRFFNGHQDDLCNDAFPGVALGLLGEARAARVSPLILKGLGVASVEQVFLHDGPLYFLPDRGDRQVAGYALLANIPIILTTDRKTFWKHRAAMKEFGVDVMRPSELLALYDPYWDALRDEFQRRQTEAKLRRKT